MICITTSNAATHTARRNRHEVRDAVENHATKDERTRPGLHTVHHVGEVLNIPTKHTANTITRSGIGTYIAMPQVWCAVELALAERSCHIDPHGAGIGL